MVHEIKQGKYKVFLEAFVLTALILMLGFFLGLFIEIYRNNSVADSYLDSEVEALDLKLQNYYYQIMDSTSCNEAIKQNFEFADKIYNDGLKIEKYEEANQITEKIVLEKKRYVLLKTELWLNSILLKKKCGDVFDTVVYIYLHASGSQAVESEQELISNMLKSVKEKKGNEIVLIPIAGNMGLQSVELQKRIYNITNLPSIIINEKKVLVGFHSEEEIISLLGQ